MPTFWTTAIFDAFGYNGIGSTGNVQRGGQVRQDNSIGYFLPSNLGGFYGQLMVAAGENGTSGDRSGRYIGGQFGFRAGPFDIAGAYAENRLGIVPIAAANLHWPRCGRGRPDGEECERRRLVRLRLPEDAWATTTRTSYPTAKEKVASISGIFPFGQSEVRVGYDMQQDGPEPAGSAGLEARQHQGDVPVQPLEADGHVRHGRVAEQQGRHDRFAARREFAVRTPTAGGDSKGFEIGIRHFF